MSLGLGPGVSIFIPDVLMGSPRKLHSHGILNEVWNMRAICLAPLPAQFSVRGPHTHSWPQPFGVDGWYMHKCQAASRAGERTATYPLFPGCIWGMVCISFALKKASLGTSSDGCAVHVCVLGCQVTPGTTHPRCSSLLPRMCSWCHCWRRKTTRPCGPSDLFSPMCTNQALVLSASIPILKIPNCVLRILRSWSVSPADQDLYLSLVTNTQVWKIYIKMEFTQARQGPGEGNPQNQVGFHWTSLANALS